MRKLTGYGPGLIVLATAIVVLLAGPRAVWYLTYHHDRAAIIQASESLDRNPILQQLNQAYRDIATLVEPSVVHISTERTVRDRFGESSVLASSGSGWIWDELGHVVTNYHVIQDADSIEVQLHTGELRQADVVGYDQFTDIALVKIPAGRLFPAVRAETGEAGIMPDVEQGDLVFAFGSPFDFRFSMSSGVVSGIGRSVGVIRDDRGRWRGYENFIQVDAAINPGNSGGPLTDSLGRVIGMNTAIATGRGSRLEEGQFAGIGLAIPIDMIEPVVSQIIDTGSVKKGFLGVSVLDQDQTIRDELQALGFNGYGLTVARIEPGNPAVDAGLRVGDVITAVRKQPVTTLAELDATTTGIGADEQVEIAVWRYDTEIDRGEHLRLMLPGVAARGFHGVSLLQIDDQIGSGLSIQGFNGRGVRIARLELDRPAYRAGLRLGDIVTGVNGQPVVTSDQLRSRISSMLPGDVAQLDLWRYQPALDGGRTLTVDVRLDRLDPLRVTGIVPPQQGPDALESLGLARLSTSTPQLAEQFNVGYQPGVLVEAVVPGSTLEGRVPPGSIIVAVMDRAVADLNEFYDSLENQDLRASRGVEITVIQPDRQRENVLLRLR